MLALAAHPDDEVLGAGVWLARLARAPAVAFLTDGVPRARRWRPPRYTSATLYRQARRREARAAWSRLRRGTRLFFAPFRDQELAFRLDGAARWLAAVAARVRPGLILAPAFEGGHPDHDAANLLAARLGAARDLPVWEFALYTARHGRLQRQRFPAAPGWTRHLRAPEAARKRRAFAAYASQRGTLRALDAGRESLRPLAAHDYSRPALREAAVYERWGFPASARRVAQAFGAHLAGAKIACACSCSPTR